MPKPPRASKAGSIQRRQVAAGYGLIFPASPESSEDDDAAPGASVPAPVRRQRRGLVRRYNRLGDDERAAFHRAILAGMKKRPEPHYGLSDGDVTPVLVYADRVEEEGRPAAAEIMRRHVGGLKHPYPMLYTPLASGLIRSSQNAGALKAATGHYWDVAKGYGPSGFPDAISVKLNEANLAAGGVNRWLLTEPDHVAAADLLRRAAAEGGELSPAAKSLVEKHAPAPEKLRRHYAAYRAPAGGLVSRGLFYPGGKYVPADGLEATPKQPVRYADGDSPPKRHKFATTQVELPPAAARRVLAVGQRIPDADLTADGREDLPHVTVQYGLPGGVDPQALVTGLRGFGAFVVRLGRLNCFTGVEKGTADAVYAEVKSAKIRSLRQRIRELPHTDTQPSYIPHATVAYVRAGLGQKFVGDAALDGVLAVVRTLTLRDTDGTAYTISLDKPTRYAAEGPSKPVAPDPSLGPVPVQYRVMNFQSGRNRIISRHDNLADAFAALSRPHNDQLAAVYADKSWKLLPSHGGESGGYHLASGRFLEHHTSRGERSPARDLANVAAWTPQRKLDLLLASLAHRQTDPVTLKLRGVAEQHLPDVAAFRQRALAERDLTPFLALADFLEERGDPRTPQEIRQKIAEHEQR